MTISPFSSKLIVSVVTLLCLIHFSHAVRMLKEENGDFFKEEKDTAATPNIGGFPFPFNFPPFSSAGIPNIPFNIPNFSIPGFGIGGLPGFGSPGSGIGGPGSGIGGPGSGIGGPGGNNPFAIPIPGVPTPTPTSTP